MKLDFTLDLWQKLASTDKTVVMYGMGNGADKILTICERYGIEVADFFASDGFVRGHSFHGKVVLSYSEIKEKYKDRELIVLLSFATSLPDVLERIKEIGKEHELLVPDVPVSGENIFNMEFFRENEEKIDEVYSLFADDESREIYRNIIEYKLSGDPSYLYAAESDKDAVYRNLLHAEDIETYADLGAYNGDTVREMLVYNKDLKSVIAFEPDRRNYRKLCEYAERESGIHVEAHNIGAWNEEATLVFDASGNRNATLMPKNSVESTENSMIVGTLGKKSTEVDVNSLDNILAGRHVDYIKYDVEGSEKEALLGAAKTIRNCRPKLLVSLYHRSEDIFALPLLVNKLCDGRKLYLRRFRYLPAWDINLYVI